LIEKPWFAIKNINILITLGNMNPENKEIECTNANNNIENRFPNHGFFYLWINIMKSLHMRMKKK